MWYNFFLENFHFAINVFAALVLFGTFWLYFDAWKERKTVKDGLKVGGLLLLSLSFVVHATTIESGFLASGPAQGAIRQLLLAVTRVSGYVVLALGLFLDPLEPYPHHRSKVAVLMPMAFPLFLFSTVLPPILAATTAILYLRRATIGWEDHLKTVAVAFFALSIYELLSLGALFRETTIVGLYTLVAAFGPVWIAEHVVLLMVAVVLGKWVFGYLLKQFQTQLFMIFTLATVAIFLVTTVTFTGLLLKNLQDETLRQLETDVKVLSFALESKKAEAISDAQVIAQNTDVQTLVGEKTRIPLSDILERFLLTKKESTLLVVTDSGQVFARGEDRQRVGDSLASDPLIKRALLGETAASVVTKEGVLAPEIVVQAATPIQQEEKVLGAVRAGVAIDNAFIDGVKTATGLEAAIYGDNQISASTFLAPDGTNRLIGIKEERSVVKERVLGSGKSYSGTTTMLNTPYFGAYLPLTDVDNVAVGMLFVGRPQISVLQTAAKSIELTFLVAAVLLVFSVAPAYFISKYLTSQIR